MKYVIKLPSTPNALKLIKGMGKVKMEMFSDDLLDIINDYRDEQNITIKDEKSRLFLLKFQK